MDSNTSRIILEAAGTIALAPVSLVSLLRQVQYDGPETSTGPGQERSPKKKDEPARQDLDLTSKLHQAETYLQQEEKNGISDPQLKSESLMKDETVKRYIVNGECVQRTSAYPTIDKSLIKCGWIESARQIYRSQVRLSIFRGKFTTLAGPLFTLTDPWDAHDRCSFNADPSFSIMHISRHLDHGHAATSEGRIWGPFGWPTSIAAGMLCACLYESHPDGAS